MTADNAGLVEQLARDDLRPGEIQWHSSEEGGGPDVGLLLQIGDDDALWLGELSRRRWDEAGQPGDSDGGWWLVRYTGRDAFVLGKCYDSDAARDCIQALGSAIREAAAALASLSEQPVAVKLEWTHYPDAFPPMWVAGSSIGHYSIEEASASDSPVFEVWWAGHTLLQVKDGLPEAKEAAQADFELRISTALAAPQPASLPEGMVLVPVEPTDEMIGAWLAYYSDERDESGFSVQARAIWAAMLAARPVTPEGEAEPSKASLLEAQIHRLTAHGDNLVGQIAADAPHGSGTIKKWEDAKAEAFGVLFATHPAASEHVPLDVARLVVAARHVAFDDHPSREALQELDQASEAFADRISWDGEPDDPAAASEAPPTSIAEIVDDADEAYDLGLRDGYERAIQVLDLATGGDGEFKGSTFHGETVDVPVMQQRIIARCTAASEAPTEAVEAQDGWTDTPDAREAIIRDLAQDYGITSEDKMDQRDREDRRRISPQAKGGE